MTAPITSSTYQIDFAQTFRQRWADRLANDGDVRNIDGFNIDVTGKAARGQQTHRSAVTPGAGTRTYDPGTASPSSPPDTGLPVSTLVTLPGNLQSLLKSAGEDGGSQAVAGENPYAVSMPAWVDIQHTEEGRPEQITTVGYYDGVEGGDAKAAMATDSAQVDRLRALADIETRLRSEFGQQVKLAWDGGAGEYLVLRPGQDGYDRIMGANTLVNRLPRDLEMMGYTQGMIRDIMA